MRYPSTHKEETRKKLVGSARAIAKRGGFGIGGYQVRELMRDLGGDVTVESVVGRGTCVTLSLPLVQK